MKISVNTSVRRHVYHVYVSARASVYVVYANISATDIFYVILVNNTEMRLTTYLYLLVEIRIEMCTVYRSKTISQ